MVWYSTVQTLKTWARMRIKPGVKENYFWGEQLYWPWVIASRGQVWWSRGLNSFPTHSHSRLFFHSLTRPHKFASAVPMGAQCSSADPVKVVLDCLVRLLEGLYHFWICGRTLLCPFLSQCCSSRPLWRSRSLCLPRTPSGLLFPQSEPEASPAATKATAVHDTCSPKTLSFAVFRFYPPPRRCPSHNPPSPFSQYSI